MDERKKIKLITIVASLALVAFIAVIIITSVLNAKKTATLETKIVPFSATITIDGKEYKPNQTYHFEPGHISVTVSAEGYESQELSLTLKDKETTTLAVALTTPDDKTPYCDTFGKECQLYEEIMQFQSSQAAEEYARQYPVSQMLPLIVVEVDPTTYDWTEYRIDCGQIEGCKTDFCIKITDTTGGNRENALKKIREGGFNPDDYEIIYEYTPVTPL